MAKNWLKKVILQKIEVTEGTDAAPVVGTDAIQVINYQPNFISTDAKTRAIEYPYLGSRPVVMAGFRRGSTFSVEIAGGGAATTVPPWMKLNRIAGWDAGTVGGSNVVQIPVSTIVSATHWAYVDNLLMKTVGARASMSIVFEDDEFPVFNYTVLGRSDTVLGADSTPGTPTLTGWQTPVLASTENTTFLLDTFALPLRRLELNSNGDLAFRSLIGPQDRVMLRDRPWSGSIVAEVPDIATKDYFTKMRPGTTMALSLTHGTTAGNIVAFAAPKVQITGDIALSEEQGIAMMTMPVTLLPNSTAGNDELTITSS